MTQQIRVGLSISDQGEGGSATPRVLMQVSEVASDVVHVQVEASGFLPSSDGATAIADMLNDVARSIMEHVARADQARPTPTADELAASARIQAAEGQAHAEDHETLVQSRVRQDRIDYAVRELVQCGLTFPDATEAAEKAVDLAFAGSTGSARRAAAVAMDPRIHSQPAVTAAVNVLRNVVAPPVPTAVESAVAVMNNPRAYTAEALHAARQILARNGTPAPAPVDTGRVSYLAHEQEAVAKGARTFPTPQRVLDGRAARREERAADKRARFNPKPSK